MTSGDAYSDLGGPVLDPRCGRVQSGTDAESILKAALGGVIAIEVAPEPRAQVKRVIDQLDLLGLFPFGAPDDEYEPEANHVASLAAMGQLSADSAWAVFAHWFGERLVPARGDVCWSMIAAGQVPSPSAEEDAR